MRSSANIFKKSIDKAFSSVSPNSTTLGDHMKYKQGFTEDSKVSKNTKVKNISKKTETKEQMIRRAIKSGLANNLLNNSETKEESSVNKSAKKQFVKDLQSDPDYIEFKKNMKYKADNSDYSYGVPNVSKDDPFISKKRYGRAGKSETKEATGSGSSGQYSGPVFGGDDAFWKRSRSENPKLKESEVEKVEATEATGSGSVGGYETPAMWAKSTKKKDWGPSRKTQYKGGSFVKVKEKCTKFPYCNQGDINSLKLSKNESVKEAIKNVANKLNISENIIITILEHEYQNKNKRSK